MEGRQEVDVRCLRGGVEEAASIKEGVGLKRRRERGLKGF